MGDTAVKGMLIGLGSMLLAAGLFIMGVVNSSRNKKVQAQRLPQNPGSTPTTD
jgi:high-affinity Fe2+/Pb2+ permease